MKHTLRALPLMTTLVLVFSGGAASGAKRANGITDLQLAVMAQDVKGVSAMLRAGTFVDEQNDLGQTALHYAVMPGLPGANYTTHLSAELLRYGADPDRIDNNGVSPLMLAVMMDNTAVIEGLLAYGGNPNAVAFNGLSMLALAEVYGNGDIAVSLRKYGARYGSLPKETELVPDLQRTVEFKQELQKRWGEHGKLPAALPGAARSAARAVWPGISESELQQIDVVTNGVSGNVSKKSNKRDLFPEGLIPRMQCSEEEDAAGEDCGDEDEEDEEYDDESSEWFVGPGYVPTPANESASNVCKTVVRTVSKVVTNCWAEVITTVTACGTIIKKPGKGTISTCVTSLETVRRCSSKTVKETIEEKKCG